MRMRALAGAAIAVAALLAGCSSVVDGTGTTDLGAPASGPTGFPSSTGGASTPAAPTASAPTLTVPSGSTPTALTPSASAPSGVAAPTPCPTVVYPAAKLSFPCLTSGLKSTFDGTVWPLSEYKTVEPSTDWVLEEGAGHWGTPDGHSLGQIATAVRQQMLDEDDYGKSPKVTTVLNRALTIDGAPAHLLQSTIAINSAWARKQGTKVRHERLWIVALQVGPNDVSLWYTSLPDLASALWAKVPATILRIKVG